MQAFSTANTERPGSGVTLSAAAPRSVCALFEQQVDRTPSAVAVLCEGRQLTYRDLDERANQLAHHLRNRCGIGPESLVGLLLGRSERMLISILAVLKAGGAYVPICPEYPAARVQYVLNDANPGSLITEARYEALAGGFERRLSWDESSPVWERESTERPAGLIDPNQLAYVMYTSGSTGTPKGVMTEHGNLSNFIEWCLEEYRDSVFDVVYAGTPYSFDLSNIEIFFPLAVGRPIRLLPASQMAGLYLRRDRRVLINTVPSLVQELVKTKGLLENVSIMNLGGEPVPLSLARTLRSYGHLEIRNMYGPTETTSTAINYRLDGPTFTEVLIGKPIDNTVVYILDENMQPVPAGVKGELYIGGKGVARGYWNRRDLNEQRFIEDPFRKGERVYRTGDLGVLLPDGNLRFLGRNDNQIKIRGYRIELDEISSHLERHASVRQAIAGLKKTDQTEKLVAICTLSGETTAGALIDFLRDAVPSYMLPDEIVFHDSFPVTPTGKIDRSALFKEGNL